MRRLPGAHRLSAHQHGGGVPVLAIGGQAENKLRSALDARAKVPVPLVVILVYVPALRRIELQPAHRGRSGERLGFFLEQAPKHVFSKVNYFSKQLPGTIDKHTKRGANYSWNQAGC